MLDVLSYEEKLAGLVSDVDSTPEAQAYDKHVEWWGLFWQRSHTSIIRNATNPASATPFTISQNIALQRYMDAGTARGAYAIKFNGYGNKGGREALPKLTSLAFCG